LQNVCQEVFETGILKEEKRTGGKTNFTKNEKV